MKRTTAQSKLTNNRFPFERYVRLYVVAQILLTYIYITKLSAFSIRDSRIPILVALVVILSGGCLIFSWKRERNWISLLCGTIQPLLMFESSCFWKYSTNIRVLLAVGGIILTFAGMIWAAKKARGIRLQSMKREFFIIKLIRAMCVLGCALFLSGCLYGRALFVISYTVASREVSYELSDEENGIPDYANSLSANIETVSQIDTDGGWRNLTIEEKMEVMQTIVRVECRYLGVKDSAPSLELAYLDEGVLGSYCRERDTVTLSYDYVVDSESDGYAILSVICHELYHRYQYYQVELLKTLRATESISKYSDLLLLDRASIYEDEFEHYVLPTDNDLSSYYDYSTQVLEMDADRYAAIAVAEYRNKIRSYLEEN